MSSSYESAKRVALGLVKEQAAQSGDDLWSISLGDSFSLRTEMPFQFFERGFEPPDEQTAQKAALMLYEGEFAADQKGAQKRFDALKQALAASDERRLSKLLAEAPLSEWFSLIFLDGDRVKDELVPLLEKSGAPCRAAMSAALDRALEQLVDFKGLLETLKTYC
jgi:hypothetical protein